MESRLVAALCERLPALGGLALEALHGGAEATAVVKISANRSMVVKTIHPRLAAEEVAQLERINAALPGLCPPVVYSEIEKGVYVTEFANGETLEKRLQESIDDPTSLAHFEMAMPSLTALRHLHVVTQRPYASEYHQTIVARRLATILRCHSTTENLKRLTGQDIENYYQVMWDTGRRSQRPLSTAMASVADRYLAALPETESLIHGDPHLGNIIVERQAPTFIDPRVTWDGDPNPNQGYFDPLYDVACVTHSILANLILFKSHDLLESVGSRFALTANALQMLGSYAGRQASHGERTRFLTYLICSLSGNLKYARWTPTAETFWLTLNFLDLLADAFDQIRTSSRPSAV